MLLRLLGAVINPILKWRGKTVLIIKRR